MISLEMGFVKGMIEESSYRSSRSIRLFMNWTLKKTNLKLTEL